MMLQYVRSAPSKIENYNTRVYDTKDWEALSVKELKGKNIAACSERSALAQNILKFLGLESEKEFHEFAGWRFLESDG